VKQDRGWQWQFEDSIPVPRERQLVTLGDHIAELSKKEAA
jgi:hypothetical protein